MEKIWSFLTDSRFLRQTCRPRSKWPTVNFFGLNEQVLFVDHFGKFFPKSFRGKGVIFALNVWAIPTKKHKIALMGNRSPLSHMRDGCYYHYTNYALLVERLQIDEVIHEIRLLMYKKHTNTTKYFIHLPGNWTPPNCMAGRCHDHYTMELLQWEKLNNIIQCKVWPNPNKPK